MSGFISSVLREELENREFRESYVAENVRRGLAYQIAALRRARGWSQAEFARQAGKPQSTIHRWEDPTYGKFSLSTLIEIASIFDVGLISKFVGFGELLVSVSNLRPDKLAILSYDKEREKAASEAARDQQNKIGSALAAFSKSPQQHSNLGLNKFLSEVTTGQTVVLLPSLSSRRNFRGAQRRCTSNISRADCSNRTTALGGDMKVVTTEGGRILDLVPLEEFRPPQGVYLPDFVSAIAARYSFASVPSNLTEAAKSGAKFETGKFMLDGSPVAIKELAVYSDGLICEAHDTRFADLVLDDFLKWATDTFKLQERLSPVRRTYTSALVCIFEKSVEFGLGKLSTVCDLLSKALSDAYGWKYQYNLNRLAFTVDPMAIPHLRSTNFIIERRLQVPYSENRYFSIAPLKTEEHVKLLETIERELLP